MSPEQLRTLLAGLERGDISLELALDRLKNLAYDDLGFARIDNHRTLRTGFPEVIFCQGKLPAQVSTIARRMTGQGVPVLGTRCPPEMWASIAPDLPDAQYYDMARAFVIPPDAGASATLSEEATRRGVILVVTGGTSDMPVAEEAVLTAEVMGNRVQRLYDVGVAGIHRLLSHGAELQQASVVIVVAGMEGALASVTAGLVAAPLIAVPTSVGYGASFGGLAALLAMLNSCAPGVAVVNIDNGFGAGVLAAKINRLSMAGRAAPHLPE